MSQGLAELQSTGPLSIAMDSEGEPSYVAAVILSDLAGKKLGKCPCHIVATTGLPERLVYEFLAELLALKWVEIMLPPEPASPLLEALRAAEQSVAVSRERQQITATWMQFFRTAGENATVPRYYVRNTAEGDKKRRAFKSL